MTANVDSQVRSLTTDLINLSEEYRFDPVKEILKGIRKEKKLDTVEKATRPQLVRKLDIIFEPVSQLFGFNVVGVWGFIFFLNIVVWGAYYRSVDWDLKKWKAYGVKKANSSCLVENYEMVSDVGRPVFDCKKCIGLTEVPQVVNITREEFLKRFAYTGVPVLIKDSIKHWKALRKFNYGWFKELYDKFDDAYDIQSDAGQFFPYKTKFEELKDAFSMSEERRNKSWYFGWNNVHPEIAKILREHYQRPAFLPLKSESSHIDWIFMGKPGPGAQVHIDAVARPSWQAQVKGKKTWELFPSAECQHVCKPINGTMQTGDIIVVDTNQWYHSTFIWPGEISITIGSEYD